MDLFLSGILTGSDATRRRHINQAKTIQHLISKRWQRDNPWCWRRKHLVWFLNQKRDQTDATRYYYELTIQLISRRLGKSWFRVKRISPNKISLIETDDH